MYPRQQFCPNIACPARGKIGENNIIVHSRKEALYQCKICRKTFATTIGTPSYRLHHPVELMVIVATLIAHGCPLPAIVAAFHLDECTVMDWQERAGRHCRRVHEQLVQQPRDLEHVQADETRVKGQSKVIWLAMAIMVPASLWLGGVIAWQRDEHLILALVQIIRQCALARLLLICMDGVHRLSPGGSAGFSQSTAKWQTWTFLADLLARPSHRPGGQTLPGETRSRRNPANGALAFEQVS